MLKVSKLRHSGDVHSKKKNEKKESSETKELTFLLNRFNKDYIVTSIIEKSARTQQDLAIINGKKAILIKQAIRLLTEKFSNLDELILFLHLSYVHAQKSSRLWNILEIKDAKRLPNCNLTSEKVSMSMLKYFNKYNVECKVFSEKKDDFIWSVLYFGEEAIPQQAFCAVPVKLSVVFISYLKPQYLLITHKVVRKTFGGSEIRVVNSFRAKSCDIPNFNIKSCKLLYAKSNGTELKEKIVKSKGGKSKVVNNSQSEIDTDPRVQSHDEIFVENDEVFENYELPVIEKLKYVYKVKCSASDINEAEEKQQEFCGLVLFEGTNILKGLEKLVDSGMADTPLPEYLWKAPRTGKTNYEIQN